MFGRKKRIKKYKKLLSMVGFMEDTYKRSKRKFNTSLYKNVSTINLTGSNVMYLFRKWKYKYDPFRGALNYIYPPIMAANENEGDCDDYAAKLYYHLDKKGLNPFLITYFTTKISKCHTIVAYKRPNTHNVIYRAFNWYKVKDKLSLRGVQKVAVGYARVFAIIYTRWDEKNQTWYTVEPSTLKKEEK